MAVHRRVLENIDPLAFGDGDTTPDISGGRVHKTANTGATVITTFDGGQDGDAIEVHVEDDNTTFAQGATLKLPFAVDFEAKQYDVLFCRRVGAVWRCK